MKDEDFNDQVWFVERIAAYLGFKEIRTRRVLARSGLTPVRTHTGIGYMSSDIKAMARQMRGHQ